ncbi:MAG: oxygen-independent coproporphyrinogen III oxidase [Sphingomonadaceae bacterium]
MWRYYPELLERPVPRYTSYPTAVEFSDRVGAADMVEALETVEPETPLSVYVHIPYCQSICWYCGCNTGAANRTHRLAAYLESLESEIGRVGSLLHGRGKVRHIAFGGGSPNAIAPVDFVRLVDRLVLALNCESADMSVEIDPRIFSDNWAMALASCGVTRVSLGVQSFSETIQQAIGRIQPRHTIEACMSSVRRFGIDNINFDLMYGLPGQSLADLEDTLHQAIELAPSRIALFGYAHLPDLVPRQRRIDATALPGSELRFEMATRGHELLSAAGYQPIGFDHFALESDGLAKANARGKLYRNFQGFTDDDSPVLLGFGASAISSFPHIMIQNEKNPGRYRACLADGTLASARGVKRSPDDQHRSAIIERILCQREARDIPEDIVATARTALGPLEALGLIEWDKRDLRLNRNALPYARVVASAFDAYRQPDSSQFSNAI